MVIKKKDKNNWEYCIYMGMDENGKKKYKRKSGFKTKKECLREAETLECKSPTKGKTFAYIGDLYLEHKIKQNLNLTTIMHYKSLYNCIKREFKNYYMPIKSIKSNDIYDYIYTSNKIRKSNSTRKIIFILKGIFNFALTNNYITKNIFDDVKPIKEIRSIQKIWNFTEIEEYIPKLKDFRYYDVIYLALETGMRLGELLGLSWDCVDLTKGIIYVEKSYISSNGICFFSTPKTDASIRQIVLLKNSLEMLKKLYKTRKSKYVFYDHNTPDRPLNPHTVTTYFRQYMDKHNIRRIRFHDLRHIHATLLLYNNINYKLLSKRLGHTNIAFTLQTYAHIMPDNEIQLFRDLPQLF